MLMIIIFNNNNFLIGAYNVESNLYENNLYNIEIIQKAR